MSDPTMNMLAPHVERRWAEKMVIELRLQGSAVPTSALRWPRSNPTVWRAGKPRKPPLVTRWNTRVRWS